MFDTLKGNVTLISAADLKGGRPERLVLRRASSRSARPRAPSRSPSSRWPGRSRAARRARRRAPSAAKKKTRKLWGDGKGKFRTKGQFSSATVRGTKWVVIDRCDGTLTRVVRGSVARARLRDAQERHRQGRQAVPRAQVQVSWVSVLAGFLVAHMVGDYLLQTDWQARHKRGGLGGDPVARRALVTHVTTYTLAFLPALHLDRAPSSTSSGRSSPPSWSSCPHLMIDDGRLVALYLARVKRVDGLNLGLAASVDQSFHVLSLFLVAMVVGAA